MSKKAVLAYSGGLDTSYCLVRYSQQPDWQVHSVLVNTGGFRSAELEEVEKRAYDLGSTRHLNLDIQDEYYEKCLRYLLFGNVLKNNTYPLSVSAERAFQAMAIAHYAKKINADCIIHGSTGAGNDQVRFDLIFQVMCPNTEIITPVRDEQLTREHEIDYLKSQGVELPWEKAKYSINKGLWGTSVGGEETLTSNRSLPEEAYPSALKRIDSVEIEIDFEKGEPVNLNGKPMGSLEIIQELNLLGGEYAIGRDVHVGDTIIGIKGRVAFEAPAAIILIKAHHLLEKHCLSRWQLIHKQPLGDWYGTLLHEGQYLDPVMRDLEAFLESSQKHVSGKVKAKLHPYRLELIGIESEYDLMQSKTAKYGEENNAWDGADARGFIKIFGNNIKIFHNVQED